MSNKLGILSGSLSVYGDVQLTGSLLGTASVAVSSRNSDTASYINVTGSNIEVNWDGSLLQLSGSKQFSVIVSETTPGTDLATGSLWWDSVTGILSVLYGDDDSVQWVEANYGGTMASASFASTASGMLMDNYSSNNFSDDSQAAAAGIPLGGVYRNGSFLQVRTS